MSKQVEKKKDRNYGMAALFYRPLVRFFRAYIQKHHRHLHSLHPWHRLLASLVRESPYRLP